MLYCSEFCTYGLSLLSRVHRIYHNDTESTNLGRYKPSLCFDQWYKVTMFHLEMIKSYRLEVPFYSRNNKKKDCFWIITVFLDYELHHLLAEKKPTFFILFFCKFCTGGKTVAEILHTLRERWVRDAVVICAVPWYDVKENDGASYKSYEDVFVVCKSFYICFSTMESEYLVLKMVPLLKHLWK